jgi:hypothetical protein
LYTKLKATALNNSFSIESAINIEWKEETIAFKKRYCILIKKTNSMKTLLFTLLVGLTMVGCNRQMYEFELIPCDKFRDSKENIKKAFQLQEADRAPNQIIVTDEYIDWIKEGVNRNMLDVPRGESLHNTVYFNKIINLSIIHPTKRYIIKFINTTSNREHVIVLYDKDIAEQGYSAIKCMMDAAKDRSQDGLY